MGSKLLYYLVILPISRMPYFLLYRVSDFFFLVLYYVVPYRKKLVYKNMMGCFPDASEKRIKRWRRQFYRYFCDLVVESLKNFTISKRSAAKRVQAINVEVINQYAAQGKSVILTGGHYTNWELWAVAAPQHLDHVPVGIYKRLSNAFFDERMRASRGKFGMKLVPTAGIKDEFEKLNTQKSAFIYAIDQSPADPKKSYWTTFLGRETACFYGAEKYAREYNLPVVYGRGQRVSRGHYTIEYILITESPNDLPYGEILERANRLLEDDINAEPQFWLWTHRRWKHRRPENLPLRSKPTT
ncbi:MAG: lysophospholipid acyltransferase family protein [Flavobacteriales bacterium]|nr:lysophospholipid acyltransferase family protein [Flavobacteriales bacterium]